MSIYKTWNGEESITFTGCVVSQRDYMTHVPSDNAMIDSGHRLDVVVWGEHGLETLTFCTGRDGPAVRVEVDATPEVLVKVERWRELFGWLASIRKAKYEHEKVQREASKVKPGVRVKVVKGRKVKKGTTWFVHKAWDGEYGPTTHLSSEPNGMGDYQRYVSQDNLEVIQDNSKAFEFPPAPFAGATQDVLNIAFAYATAEGYREDTVALMTLRDALTDAGCYGQAEVIGWKLGS